jgi:hypothetical protein
VVAMLGGGGVLGGGAAQEGSGEGGKMCRPTCVLAAVFVQGMALVMFVGHGPQCSLPVRRSGVVLVRA